MVTGVARHQQALYFTAVTLPTTAPEFVTITWGGRTVCIEHAWIAPERHGAPLLVFLHEGLGSLAMWKDFPGRLCDALGWRGLVYSRPGYGRSSPREPGEIWAPDFMHRQAQEVLPALLTAVGVDTTTNRPWLLGHSDGGSIALLFAAHHPPAAAGVIVLAPHIMVEPITRKSIEHSRIAYQSGTLRDSLARYHDSPDSAFWGWNRVWLDPAFAAWRIDDDIAAIRCPLLAVQGYDDVYGTLEQIRGIQRRVPHTQLLELPRCGHSPHRDQPEALTDAIIGFTRQHAAGA
jgi:pimeloyl-ACP methyl ester carboxylesterase